jgi:hypothetical protein
MTKHKHIQDRERKNSSSYIMNPSVSSDLVKKGFKVSCYGS